MDEAEYFRVVPSPDERVLRAIGELDIASSSTLAAALGPRCEHDQPDIVLDVARLTFIDAAGLRLLMQVSERVSAKGGRFTLRDPSPQLARLLRLTGLSGVLNVEG